MNAQLRAARALLQALRWLRLLWLLALGLSGAARADCPPPPQPPSAAQLALAQRAAADHGVLWRLDKDGRSSWLYGTLHVGRLDWAFPGPRLRQALQASELLALELDPLDPAVQQALASPAHTANTADAAAEAPDAATQARLDALARADCLPPALLAGKPALLQAMTLAVLAGRRDGLEPGYGQEIVLSAAAHAQGRPVQSLETAQGQLDALLGGDAATQAALVREQLDQLESGQARGVLGRMAALWAAGDLDALANQETWCDCQPSAAEQALLARLNEGRNPALAERIAALHDGGARLLAAVGALHLTGPQALPRLLAQRGFLVQRIWPAPI